MPSFRLAVLAVPVFLLAIWTSAFSAPAARQTPAAAATPQTDLLVIYLADFELSAVPTPASTKPAGAANPDSDPAKQARQMVAFLSLSLTTALKNAGYTVQPFAQAESRPDKGLLLRGVFTEPDEYNRVRRAIYGSASLAPKFVVYVGVANLARPEQPLYQIVPPNTPGLPTDPRLGPLITITSYSPVTSFDLDRHPSDDSIKRMAADIVTKVTALVAANPALAQ